MNNLIKSLSLLYNWILKLNLVKQAEYIHVMRSFFWCVAEESIRSVYAFVSDMKEKMSKLQYQKQLLLHRVREIKLQVELKHSACVSIYIDVYVYSRSYLYVHICTLFWATDVMLPWETLKWGKIQNIYILLGLKHSKYRDNTCPHMLLDT